MQPARCRPRWQGDIESAARICSGSGPAGRILPLCPERSLATGLNKLLRQRSDVWRSADRTPLARPSVASGSRALDQQLGGGWPRGAITEILCADNGGPLALLLPALASLSRQQRWLVLVAPPHIPYAPALAAHGVELQRLLLLRPLDRRERLWALEQTLRSGACSAVLAWPERLQGAALRRLQLAAEHGDSCGFLCRPEAAATEASVAALRLRFRRCGSGIELDILKRHGGWPVRGVPWRPDHA